MVIFHSLLQGFWEISKGEIPDPGMLLEASHGVL